MTSERPSGIWIERLLAFAVALGLAYAFYHLADAGYLPAPYFYEVQDTWMDWFNPAYWSHHEGAYDTWATIYPPLTFAFLKVVTWGPCYATLEIGTWRGCDWLGVAALHLVYVGNIVLTYLTLKKFDKATAVVRTFALCAGFPMTFGLDRGNLIIVGYTCILLAYGPLVRSARLRWLFAGLAVNFKIYLIGPIFAQILKRRWRWAEGAIVATLLVYLVTYVAVGAGSPFEIFDNIQTFTSVYQAGNVLDLWYANTYKPVLSLLQAPTFPILRIIGSDLAEQLAIILPLLTLAVQATIVAAACAAAWRPAAVSMNRLVFLSLGLTLVTSELGGYTQILLILFVFMERFKGYGRPVAIVAAYLLCIAVELPLDRGPVLFRDSYLTGRPVIAEIPVGAFPFVRPFLVWTLCVSMALVTLREVWTHTKAEGKEPHPTSSGTTLA